MFAYLRFFALVCLCSVKTYGFNLDTRTATIYSHPNRTGNDFFGFTVALHLHHNTRWLLVGAPLSDVISSDGKVLPKYGTLFKCETAGSKECAFVNVDNEPEEKKVYPTGSSNEVTMETKSGQWLGATLKSKNGTVLVCAPRYAHKKEARYKDKYSFVGDVPLRPWLSGGCYLLHSNLTRHDEDTLRPWGDTRSSYSGNSQTGFSAGLMSDEAVVMGKVGGGFPPTHKMRWLYGAGGVDMYSLTSKVYKHTSRTNLDKNDYMGYDVASGFFSDTANKELIAGGAPRGTNMKGKVLIYDAQQHNDIVFKSQLELPKEIKEGSKEKKTPFGTYFGSALCSVDLNNDGMTDLLVGAPLYTDTKDEGRVYVYLNKMGVLTLSDTVLKGDNLQGARFGTAIANVGDLNRDGYQDVVIGAPYEGHNNSGAAYVYYGTKNGIEAKYRQKIQGESLNKKLRGFGYSIAGAVDVDGNAYPDVAVGSYWSGHAVLLKTRRIVEVQAFIRPNRTRIVLENKNFICTANDGTKHKCLNLTVCFSFKDREPSNRQDLEIAFHMEADADIIPQDYRRIYFYNGKDKRFTVDGKTTIPKQGKEHCLTPYTVHINEKIHFLDLLKKLTFDLKFFLADKGCESVLDVPCPILDAYQPTSLRNDEVMFQKQCVGEVCKPDLSVTGRVQLPGNRTVLLVGTEDVLTVHMDIENLAKDASYQSTVSLYFPANLSYIGPTSTKNVLCSSNYGNETYATCNIGNPFKAKTKKSLSIEFSAQEVTNDFVIIIIVASANNDTNLVNNRIYLPLTTKYLTDMELTGISQPHDVIYKRKADTKKNVKNAGPVVIQTVIIKNHGPSFVDGAIASVQVPKLNDVNDPDSTLLYLDEVQLSGGPGKCNAITNSITVQQNTSEPALRHNTQQQVSSLVKSKCLSAACYSFECRLGKLAMDREIQISMTVRLNQHTLIKIKQSKTRLVTTAQLRVPPDIMQTDTSNDNVEIILLARPSSEAKKEEISWWIIMVSILGGLILLAGIVYIMYKCGFFRRSRPDKDDALPEEAKPMKV